MKATKALVTAGILFTALSFQGKAIAKKSIHKKALKYSKPLKYGLDAFRKEDYKRAQDYFRRHLRKYKKDYDSWNYLAASYYHLGLPKKSLRYLKYIYRKTKLRSFNLLYRGMCHLTLKDSKQAMKVFKRAIEFHDRYASVAMFELALLHYHARSNSEARKWGETYLKRFPKGNYAKKAKMMLDSIALGNYLKDLSGIKRPNMTKTKYRYHHLSLFNFPHFWLLQIGNEVFDFTGKRPDQGRQMKEHKNRVFGVLSNFGLGLGPFRSEYLSAWIAYTYMQKWLTNNERLKTFMEDVSDIKYIPFRFDLLERTHRLSGGTTVKLSPHINFGVYASFSVKLIGSSQFSDPAGFHNLKGKIPIADRLLMLPWVGFSYLNYFRSFFYLYLEKIIDASNDFSNMTYGTDGGESSSFGDIFLSMGTRHVVDLPEYHFSLAGDFFVTRYMFNDYWLDFERLGGTMKIKVNILDRANLAARFGIFRDNYPTERLKMHGCETILGEDAAKRDLQIKLEACERSDQAVLYELSGNFDFSPTKRAQISLVRVVNSNTELREYERQENKIRFLLTFSFPSAKNTLRYVDKFADEVYLIGKEDYGYIR